MWNDTIIFLGLYRVPASYITLTMHINVTPYTSFTQITLGDYDEDNQIVYAGPFELMFLMLLSYFTILHDCLETMYSSNEY